MHHSILAYKPKISAVACVTYRSSVDGSWSSPAPGALHKLWKGPCTDSCQILFPHHQDPGDLEWLLDRHSESVAAVGWQRQDCKVALSMSLLIWNLAWYRAFTVVQTPIARCSCKTLWSQISVWLLLCSRRFGLLCCYKPPGFLATWYMGAETKTLAEYMVVSGPVVWNSTIWLDCTDRQAGIYNAFAQLSAVGNECVALGEPMLPWGNEAAYFSSSCIASNYQ